MILKHLSYFGQEESLSFPVVIVSLSNDYITIQELNHLRYNALNFYLKTIVSVLSGKQLSQPCKNNSINDRQRADPSEHDGIVSF